MLRISDRNSKPRDQAAKANQKKAQPSLYGTFEGVFTPTVLTILGAIMYLRLGWVVGNAGLLGAIMVILLACSITLATGLSLASIATNTRLDAGGPYAIISRALGLETGGSIGLPLFLSQTLAVSMYIFAFREGWLYLFPEHNALAIDLISFALVALIAYISAGLMFRIQFLVLALMGISLLAVLFSDVTWQPATDLVVWGEFPGSADSNFSGTNFWGVFAVFFPATTGIMAGANMSGELRDSRRSIPAGALSAIVLSTIIYVLLCFWFARAGSTDELVSNYTIMTDRVRWGWTILAGLLGATFSQAISSLVGASRILLALAKNEVVPQGKWVSQLSNGTSGEPRNALLISATIALTALMLRNLNAIAPLITMFFLITYATLNLVLFIESSLGLTSFRPTLRIPRIVSLFGFVGCLLSMFIINATLSLIAIAAVLFIPIRIANRQGKRQPANISSGLFESIARWAASKVVDMDMTTLRAWRPNVLLPIEDNSVIEAHLYQLLTALCKPEGVIKLVGFTDQASTNAIEPKLEAARMALREQGAFTTSAALNAPTDVRSMVAVLQALKTTFFGPNILFLQLPYVLKQQEDMLPVFETAQKLKIGVVLFSHQKGTRMGQGATINLWIRPQIDDEIPMQERLRLGSINLSVLLAFKLARAWDAELNLISTVTEPSQMEAAKAYVDALKDLCRIPNRSLTYMMMGHLDACMAIAPRADISFIGLAAIPDFDFVTRMQGLANSSCLFIGDSGGESALA
ncbi:transporter, cation-chloride cotransporter (CCC) family [Thalassoporum mexicanum PCC 7367]|uniref:transporter cation-chloride cotransporter (CCC) family n=1 Tax=Thalassoporum mexicanum TaxID=3457544 RepID=UPI00029F9738|nr:transporter cation-chloride cotransporter (CCC) family [Pseudanabaena sp. PCC 7367]AFY69447.1 transporter, cation-chloride cotransporter (CCC) family [Pseudanabaena sp. PCC 7367]